MELQLHNGLSGRKEVFRPIDPQRVTMYVCGPTVYGHVHIGNGRPAVVFDVLYRVLQTLYPRVVYACNVTDVDDKINRRALANGEPIGALAERFTRAYNDDIAALGVLDTGLQPRATEHIADIVAMIEVLIDKGVAYAAEGHVLFHVPADPQYGSLSRRSLEDMLDGARVEVAPYKRDPKDFVLWKPSTPELPGWPSPWGRGRPGWHIECSAMIRKHLGPSIDIHGGGIDLAFPHHENEAAQSRCANESADCVRYWLHNGMLTIGDEKMSKSLGNIVTIRSLREHHAGETLRYALLSGQYRSPLAWSDTLLAQARRSLDALYQALRGSEATLSQSPPRPKQPQELTNSATVAGYGAEPASGTTDALPNEPDEAGHRGKVTGSIRPIQNETAAAYRHGTAAEFPESVLAALLDDLNTPAALAAMHGIAAELNKAGDRAEVARLRSHLCAGGWLLGLLDATPNAWFQKPAGAAPQSLATEAIRTLIDKRTAARRARDYAAADRIRDELAQAGIELEDTREGTLWKRV